MTQKYPSASSQTEHQVNGAHLFDVVVGEFPLYHLSAFVKEPHLAHLYPFSALDLCLEVAHRLIGFNIIGAHFPLLVSEEHLDCGRLGHQQGHLGAGLETVVADGQGFVVQLGVSAVDEHQLLPQSGDSEFSLDVGFQGAHRVLRVHPQAVGRPIQHNNVYIHDKNGLEERYFER